MLALTKVDQLISFIDNQLNRNDKSSTKSALLCIDSICTYPIKSCAAIIMDKTNDSFPFTRQGLKYDRAWMVMNAKTKDKLTQRKCPKLALIQPILTDTHLLVTVGNKQCNISLSSKQRDCGDEVAKMISEFIGIECRLIKNESTVQAWDSHPLLIVFKESIQCLNEKVLNQKNVLKYDYLRFRLNLLLSGLDKPFAEEGIKHCTVFTHCLQIVFLIEMHCLHHSILPLHEMFSDIIMFR